MIARWQTKIVGNHNPLQNLSPNPNQDIWNISTQPRETYIVVVTRGGVVMREDQEAPYGKLQVQLAAQKKAPYDVQKERELFLDARPSFVDKNQASTFATTLPRRSIMEMPERFD